MKRIESLRYQLQTTLGTQSSVKPLRNKSIKKTLDKLRFLFTTYNRTSCLLARKLQLVKTSRKRKTAGY